MRYYTAVVHQEGDSVFGLSFPDLPGCFAAAEDWEEIPEKVSEALDLYFEDMETVEPRPLNALRALPEVQEALGEGATLMAVPYIAPDGTQVGEYLARPGSVARHRRDGAGAAGDYGGLMGALHPGEDSRVNCKLRMSRFGPEANSV